LGFEAILRRVVHLTDLTDDCWRKYCTFRKEKKVTLLRCNL